MLMMLMNVHYTTERTIQYTESLSHLTARTEVKMANEVLRYLSNIYGDK